MRRLLSVRTLLYLILLLFLLVAGATLVLLVAKQDIQTKLAAISDVLALGALAFAMLAAFVATLAYGVTILKPNLRAEVRFGHGNDNGTLFVTKPEGPPQSRHVISSMQSVLFIRLHNNGPVSARNPALQVKLIGMMFDPKEQEGWSFGDHFHGLGGYGWAQWDGGADFSIHPKLGRDLPLLRLDRATVFSEPEPAIHLMLVADGYSSEQTLAIRLKESDTGSIVQ